MPHAPSSCPAHRDPQLQPKRKPKRKPPPNRRIQVTDSEGWTKVTNTTQARRAFSSPSSTRTSTSNANDEIRSSEPPHNLTLPTLRKQFEACRAKWLESETWRVMEGVLRRGISASVSASWSGSSPGFGSGSTAGIHQIISIGLGSPSGFLAGGWVDRRIVSLYQLAGLVSIRDLYETYTQKPPPIYAQDPVFNNLDKSLLESLNITVLDHPRAFSTISSQTLLYCPGAERVHLEQMLDINPGVVIGGPLEDTESGVLERFVESRRERVRVPGFGGCEVAFWGCRVYCG